MFGDLGCKLKVTRDFFINDLIELYCLRHVSNNQVSILRKNCTCSFMVFFQDPDIDQGLVQMHEKVP